MHVCLSHQLLLMFCHQNMSSALKMQTAMSWPVRLSMCRMCTLPSKSNSTALVPTEKMEITERERVVLPDHYRSITKRDEKERNPMRLPVRAVPKRLPPLPSSGDLLKMYRIRAKKQLSQNFLLNPRVCERLVSCAHIREGTRVLEIGPGPGNITRRILEKNPAELYVVEKDRRFLPMLEQLADAASPGQMKIVLGDCLDYSFETLFSPNVARDWTRENDDVSVVANLPFAVSIPLLIRWLKFMSTRSGIFVFGRVPMTLVFQKEVSLRIRAPPLSMYRSRIAIMVQTFCKTEHKFYIKGASFVPPPKVDAGVLRLIPREESYLPEGMDFNAYEKFVRCFVHYRRHPIRKNIADLFPKDKFDLMEEIFRETGFSGDDLPLMFSTDEVAAMAGVWFRLCKENPGLIDYDYRSRQRPPKVVKEQFERTNWA